LYSGTIENTAQTLIETSMPETENRLMRPLKKAFPSKGGVFGELLWRTVREPDLACTLALVYESLERDERNKLVQNVVVDARAEGIDISVLLVALLAVERDVQIARLIATEITVDGGEVLAPSCRANALRAGDEQRGGAIVVRPLYASFVEVYAIVWNSQEGITHALCEPIANAVDATQYAQHLPDGLAFNEAPLALAVDLVAKVLWNQRRRFGPLPAEMYGFAELFRE